MTKRKLRYSGLGLAVLMIGAVAACSSDNSNPGGGGGSGPTAGTHSGGTGPGTGGAPGTGGSNVGGTSTGGSATTAGTSAGGSAGFACTNTMPACASITDGANLVSDASRAGDFKLSGAVEGGTYTYAANALKLDSVGSSALNVKGNVKTYDGFGIFFNTCYDVKTLGYTGVSFSIKGSAGPTGMVGFRVQTNSNTAIDATNKKGTCVASNPTDTYPDCHAAEKPVPVTSTPTVITVNFADLTGGVPTAGVSGADVVGIEWALAWDPKWAAGAGGSGAGGSAAGGAAAGGSAAGGAASGGSGGKAGSGAGGSATGGTGAGGTGATAPGPYDADITIDDVKFIGGPATPAVCPAGTGGSGAGGSSSGGSSSGGSSSGGSSAGGTSSGGSSSGGKAGSGGHAGG
ncbi:MAG TPA: hypothetical protein VER96_15940 [Polyangiaceae bacterium]|nr:hypothetical protein [Polyangiaceae bacterium]